EQRDQHLLETDVLGLVFLRDLRQRIAAAHGVGVAFTGFRARRRREGALASRTARRSSFGTYRRNRFDRLRYRNSRWIEQERVVADDTPRSPVHFDDQIDIRLVDRLRGGDFQIRRVIRALLDRDARTRQGRGVLNVVVTVDGKVGDFRDQRIEFVL